ncbi:hypothetical protein COX69_03640 [Candidatus Falkowbacteria bacterium CG_4_10_14_0_2_um_filter_48_10]|nr:MAG: hypothetical protein COX69_03640 [Candidatus Falkowbacteria bacterium CG_4_10_14_0_2_um_filter_48_10]
MAGGFYSCLRDPSAPLRSARDDNAGEASVSERGQGPQDTAKKLSCNATALRIKKMEVKQKPRIKKDKKN